VAYVIGQAGVERDLVERTLREETGMAIARGAASKATLSALGSRNVRLIAVSAGALESVGFRNEFALRCHQPRLGSVPVLVYGVGPAAEAAAARMPGLVPVGHAGSVGELRSRLQARIRTIDDGTAPAASAADDATLSAV
jgi:hypothetical protein